MTTRKSSLWILTAVVVTSCLTIHTTQAAGERLSISQPSRDGAEAACRVTLQGHAILEPGQHAWILAARKDFADLGLVWLQGEAEVDPSTKEFSLPASLGVPDDVGSSFRLSVAILDEPTHNRMKAKLIEMMTTNRHLPVPFPPTVAAPVHRMVKKVSHSGC